MDHRINSKLPTTSVRKRALSACELCRAKKTKCDNRKPSCESCLKVRAKCMYKASNIDQLPSETTNQAVLERLNYLVQLVEVQNERNSLTAPSHLVCAPVQAAAAQTPNSNLSLNLSYPSPYVVDAGRPSAKTLPEDTTILSEPADLTCETRGSCETLLEWPVFENRYPASGPKLFIFQSEVTKSLEEKSCLSRQSNSNTSRRSINADDALRLARKFFSHVHIKNPVLEEQDLFDIAREVMEHGFGWDERSCLMVRLLC